MILTLRELADYLRVNERTIMRMLKNDQIKGAKIGGQWRFNGSQIDRLFFPEGKPGMEPQPLETIKRSHIGLTLSRVMAEDRMMMDLQGQTVEDIITELTPAPVLSKFLMNPRELRTKCMDREKLLSTGVGNGVAVPHPRDPLAELRAPGIVVFGRSRKGVEFASADGAPVHLFFLLCCHSVELHLHLMGRLAQTLKASGFTDACKAAETPQDILRLVLEVERDLFLK